MVNLKKLSLEFVEPFHQYFPISPFQPLFEVDEASVPFGNIRKLRHTKWLFRVAIQVSSWIGTEVWGPFPLYWGVLLGTRKMWPCASVPSHSRFSICHLGALETSWGSTLHLGVYYSWLRILATKFKRAFHCLSDSGYVVEVPPAAHLNWKSVKKNRAKFYPPASLQRFCFFMQGFLAFFPHKLPSFVGEHSIAFIKHSGHVCVLAKAGSPWTWRWQILF